MGEYYMGLDLSVRGAAAVILDADGQVVDHGVWGEDLPRGVPVKRKIERLIYIADKIISMGKVWSGYTSAGRGLNIGIEDYAYRMRGAQNDLGEIHGAVKTQIWLALGGVPTMIVASSARKKVLGKGRFSKGRKGKQEIIEAVRERGFDTDNDNVADAYVVAECLRLRMKENKDDG